MQEMLPVIITIMLSILTLMMVIVGILVIRVLLSLKKTLERVNDTLDTAEDRLSAVVSPLMSLGGMAASMKVGVKVFESFLGWMNRKHQED